MESSQVKAMIASKVGDPTLFRNLGSSSPLPNYMTKLREHWLSAVKESIIPRDIAKQVVGITDSMIDTKKGRPSTLDKYKAGNPHFTVSPKLHKMEVNEIKPGVDLPCRLITSLASGPTVRADKFIAYNYLKQLSIDYCSHLIQDTTQFLKELEVIDQTRDINSTSFLFNIDIVALYDSIQRKDIDKSMREAIAKWRPGWDPAFVEWLLTSIHLSLDSSVAEFDGNWYEAMDGVATGGTLCVHVANILVFFAFDKVIYSQNTPLIAFFFRFIDDCTGCWTGPIKYFYSWFKGIYTKLASEFNIRLTFNIVHANNFIEFLDVQYRFIDEGLDTDIFYKPTDAHRYVNYTSNHAPHVFRSVVYSQGLRYRRIIKDDQLLAFRFQELKRYFIDSDYPSKMTNDILNEILKSTPRSLEYKDKSRSDDNVKMAVPWIMTYGPGYKEVCDITKGLNSALIQSPLFNSTHTPNNPVLKVVTRRAPNLRDKLFNQKKVGLNICHGLPTTKCNSIAQKKCGRPCSTCPLMSSIGTLHINNQPLYCVGGGCKTSNINYCAQCTKCPLAYFGKSVQPLGRRITAHRDPITIMTPETEITDANTLAAHAYNTHGATTKADFNSIYKFSIVARKEPINLTINEQFLINKFKTYKPLGLNLENPVSMTPILVNTSELG